MNSDTDLKINLLILFGLFGTAAFAVFGSVYLAYGYLTLGLAELFFGLMGVINFMLLKRLISSLEHHAHESRKFQMAVESASDHIVITDGDGKILYGNPSAERLTGYSLAEMIGTKAGKLWGGVMDKKVYEDMWHRIKTEKLPYEGVITNVRKGNIRYDALAKISPVLDKRGSVRFFIGIERDISKEKELERAKDQFLSVASHELRTPLTAIDGLVSMIRAGEFGAIPDSLHPPLTDINSACERLIHLVNDLLNVSRIQAGRLKFSLTEFNIKTAITETTDLLSVVAKDKGITIDTQAAGDALVVSDEDKVKQILNNLIGNSLKFTDSGSITVTVTTSTEFATVSVKDTGIGIRPEDVTKLFGKFAQLESGKGRPAGTGLGLYISRELSQKLGGDLRLLDTAVGKGSTFAFTVPLAGSNQAALIRRHIEEDAKANPDKKSDTISKQ